MGSEPLPYSTHQDAEKRQPLTGINSLPGEPTKLAHLNITHRSQRSRPLRAARHLELHGVHFAQQLVHFDGHIERVHGGDALHVVKVVVGAIGPLLRVRLEPVDV